MPYMKVKLISGLVVLFTVFGLVLAYPTTTAA